MSKLIAMVDVLRLGSAVTDPKLWKDRAALAMALSALFVALNYASKAFGYDLGLSNEDAGLVGTAVATVAGLFSHYATSEKTGLLPPKSEPGVETKVDMRGTPD